MKLIYTSSTILIITFILADYVYAANTTQYNDKIEIYDPKQSYCFRFTWFGPEYDNTTSVNITCRDYLENTRAIGIPCRQPIVITYDGTPPDIDYVWHNHRNTVICKRTKGQVCAKYSYSFNNEVQNITYMCTKVSAKGEGAVKSGCYTQTVNDYQVELCVCESTTGAVMPCNSTSRRFLSQLLLGLTLVIVSVY